MSEIIQQIFSENGFLPREIKDFESRPTQEQMASFIYENISDGEVIVAEAGTGTGKTLAYLIPALYYALENDKKLIVTTETRALQKQLIDKDIPVVRSIFENHLNMKFKHTLCIGGTNYPCRRRFDLLKERGAFGSDSAGEIKLILDYFRKEIPFTLLDLRVSVSLWSEIHREGEACRPSRCYYSPKCPFQLARKEWAESHLLVMNHYLFFTNVASNKTYIPEGDIVIFDEAHSIEAVATSQLGFELSQSDLEDICARLLKDNKRGGFIDNVSDALLREKFIKQVNDTIIESGSFYNGLQPLFPEGKYSLRLKSQLNQGIPFYRMLKQLVQLVSEIDQNISEDDSSRIEFDPVRSRLTAFTDSLGLFIYQGDVDFVYWIEKSRKELISDITLFGRPVDVSSIMRDEVFAHYDATVLTSATLAVRGGFDYICGRLGIDSHRGIVLESPFDFMSQMIFFIPRDIPAPFDPLFAEEAARISGHLIKFLEGNCMMLFTSYKNLKEVKQFLEYEVDNSIYSQSDMNASDAVRSYIEDDGSVLMGTHSFWQGMDFPGDQLRGLILMKLPFSVPDTPLYEAKTERIVEAGKNPFYSLQVPEAVIKFKQGFGRLIRSRSDMGIISVLDSRIISKSYGREFIKALPECRKAYTLSDLFSEYEEICNSAKYPGETV